MKQEQEARPRFRLSLVVAAVLMAAAVGLAQSDLRLPPLPTGAGPAPKILDHYPEVPSQEPAFTIPMAPLGFSPPGVFYLLRRRVLVSLDFVSEDRLLFSFQAAGGLVSRDAAATSESRERRVRAVIVALPEAKIEAETQWVVPDQGRYLWMLKDGNFLLRDMDGLEQGDATLKIAPSLKLPGKLLWIALDPTQKVMVVNSLENATDRTQESGADSRSVGDEKQQPDEKPTLAVRTIERGTGHVIRTLKVPWSNQSDDWPIGAGGYLESVHSNGMQWNLVDNSFDGGRRGVGEVDSACRPNVAYVSEGEILVSTCDPGSSSGSLIAMSTSGSRLWEEKTSSNTMWPLCTMSGDGSRIAREILILNRDSKHYKSGVDAADLRGQMVRVLDATNGKTIFEAPVNPMLDGGGNVAVSPSGRRIAILNDGAIQVFDLGAQTAPRPTVGK